MLKNKKRTVLTSRGTDVGAADDPKTNPSMLVTSGRFIGFRICDVPARYHHLVNPSLFLPTILK